MINGYLYFGIASAGVGAIAFLLVMCWVDRQLTNRKIQQVRMALMMVNLFFEGDEDKVDLWFKTPNPFLGEMSPKTMIESNRVDKFIKAVTCMVSQPRP